MNIPILYEDEWLLAVDKPSGLLVIPTPKQERRTLTSILNDEMKARSVPSCACHPCHRLDRDTSGVIVYAKGKSAQKKMMDLFRQRQVKKRYTVFVQGRLQRQQGEITAPVEGMPACTRYRLIEQRKDFAVIEAEPVTGRTNQIRIHFKHICHPVVGDTKFAFRRDFALKASRLCLHAASVRFPHPVTGAPVAIEADIPAQLQRFLETHQ